jgi:hypothetical protein
MSGETIGNLCQLFEAPASDCVLANGLMLELDGLLQEST